MTAQRFPFFARDLGDDVLLATDCGGLIRSRHMPRWMLETIGELFGMLRARGEGLLAAGGFEVPAYPQFASLAEGTIGETCRGVFGASRNEDGSIERVIALYDFGDDSAPVLVLVAEQIDEFLAKV